MVVVQSTVICNFDKCVHYYHIPQKENNFTNMLQLHSFLEITLSSFYVLIPMCHIPIIFKDDK